MAKGSRESEIERVIGEGGYRRSGTQQRIRRDKDEVDGEGEILILERGIGAA